MLLVFVQPDLGTALVYVAALAAVLFVAGMRWSHLAVLGAAIALLGDRACSGCCPRPASTCSSLPGGAADRLHATRRSDPARRRPTTSTQSIIAVGAGGVDGRGVAGATQTNLDYLPEHATDFAFASLAEQRGFVGAAVLLLLYLLVVWRGLKVVADRARRVLGDRRRRASSFAFLFQIFVNVGMTIGIAPITGIPLPFGQRRRLVDDREPARDRRAAGDPRPRLRPPGATGKQARSPATARESGGRCSADTCGL